MDYRKFLAEDFASDDFFISWVNGSDPNARAFWESFLKNNPDKAFAIEEAKKMIDLLQFREDELTEEDIASMRSNILATIHEGDNIKTIRPKSKAGKVLFALRWAAIITLPLALLAAVYLLLNEQARQSQLATRDSAIETRLNPRGQRSVLLLPDGSKVWLNADSNLDFSKDFNTSSTREVFLKGEAYFDVVRNPNKPFIVRTSAISIRVLGTAFNVKSYDEDRTIETTLVHGKVSISKIGATREDEQLILAPNQRAVFRKSSNTINVEQVAAERNTAWRFEKLVFDETPFYDVIARLERWYDVKIHVGEQELSCRLTAEIEHEKLEDVLKLLEVSHNIKWQINGKEVFISGSFCK
jgi:transmembrane sensor